MIFNKLLMTVACKLDILETFQGVWRDELCVQYQEGRA